MALAFATITDSIAGISVSGVTIKDIDEIPESVLPRDCPIMYPEPDGFISGLTYTRDSTGGGSTALATVTYNMTYAFLYTSVGAGRGLFDIYDDMLTKVGLIIDAIIISDGITGVVDLTIGDAIQFGAVPDPAGNMFIGTRLVFGITEFVN